MKSSYYKEVKFFIVLIPFINVINYYLTYSKISFSWFTFITFTLDTIEGYIAWFAVRSIILFLDKKLPYKANPVKRILCQNAVTTLAGMLAIILLTEFVNFLATDKPVPAIFYTKDIFIISIWFFVVNSIYVGLHYYNQWRRAEELHKEERRLREDENRIRTAGLMVKLGKQNSVIAFADIACFYVEGEYAVVCTIESKKHFMDQSLDKVEKTLPSELFFRLNRQLIIHREFVTGFERMENGKLNILIKRSLYLPSTTQVSRLKAPSFKQWLHSAQISHSKTDEVLEA